MGSGIKECVEMTFGNLSEVKKEKVLLMVHFDDKTLN